MAARRRAVRQRRPHGAAPRGAAVRRARGLHQRAAAPALQGVQAALDARHRRTLDRLSAIHRRRPDVSRAVEAAVSSPAARALSGRRPRPPAREGRPGGADSILGRLGCVPGRYTLVVPGGGTNHPGTGDAMVEFAQAARELASAGEDTVFVGRAPAAAAAVRAAPAAAGLTAPAAAGPPHRPLRAVCASRARCRRATWRS